MMNLKSSNISITKLVVKYALFQYPSLDSGKVESELKKWHNLKICFKDSLITSYIDENKVSEITNNRFYAGMAGIGDYFNTCFSAVSAYNDNGESSLSGTATSVVR